MTATAGDDAYPNIDYGMFIDFDGHFPRDSDSFERNEVAVRMEPPPTWTMPLASKLAEWLPVTDETIIDAGTHLRVVPIDFGSRAASGMLFAFEPWRAPNRNPMPTVVPFPRLARAERRTRAALQRVRDAFDVLRHGLPETDW